MSEQNEQEVQSKQNCGHTCMMCVAIEEAKAGLVEEITRGLHGRTNGNGHATNGHTPVLAVRASASPKLALARPRKRGLHFRPDQSFKEQVLAMNKEGVNRNAIARKLNTTWGTVNNIIKSLP